MSRNSYDPFFHIKVGNLRPRWGTYVLFLFLLLACSGDDAGLEMTELEVVVKSYGGDLNDNAKAVVPTSDGGFAVLGHTQSDNGDIDDKENTSFDYWLLKFDENGDLQWSKTYGGSGDDRGNSLLQTSDGGFAILGYSQSTDGDLTSNAGAQDHWVAKTDASGNLIWQESFGFSGRDEGISLIATRDSGFLLVGILDVTASGGQGTTLRHAGGDYWAVKIDQNGALEWSNFYGGTFTDTAFDAVQTSEGAFILVGSSDSTDVDITDNKGTYDFWVLKVAENGELLWKRNFGGAEVDEARAITRTSDGNYLILGETRSSNGDVSENNGGADAWILKITDEGELLWERTYGGSSFEAGRDIFSSRDGSYLVAGSSRSSDGDVESNKGQNDAWVFKIDEEGNLLWERAVGGSQIDFAHGIAELPDGSVVAVGETSSSDFDIAMNNGFTDLLVILLKE